MAGGEQKLGRIDAEGGEEEEDIEAGAQQQPPHNAIGATIAGPPPLQQMQQEEEGILPPIRPEKKKKPEKMDSLFTQPFKDAMKVKTRRRREGDQAALLAEAEAGGPADGAPGSISAASSSAAAGAAHDHGWIEDLEEAEENEKVRRLWWVGFGSCIVVLLILLIILIQHKDDIMAILQAEQTQEAIQAQAETVLMATCFFPPPLLTSQTRDVPNLGINASIDLSPYGSEFFTDDEFLAFGIDDEDDSTEFVKLSGWFVNMEPQKEFSLHILSFAPYRTDWGVDFASATVYNPHLYANYCDFDGNLGYIRADDDGRLIVDRVASMDIHSVLGRAIVLRDGKDDCTSAPILAYCLAVRTDPTVNDDFKDHNGQDIAVINNMDPSFEQKPKTTALSNRRHHHRHNPPTPSAPGPHRPHHHMDQKERDRIRKWVMRDENERSKRAEERRKERAVWGGNGPLTLDDGNDKRPNATNGQSVRNGLPPDMPIPTGLTGGTLAEWLEEKHEADEVMDEIMAMSREEQDAHSATLSAEWLSDEQLMNRVEQLIVDRLDHSVVPSIEELPDGIVEIYSQGLTDEEQDAADHQEQVRLAAKRQQIYDKWEANERRKLKAQNLTGAQFKAAMEDARFNAAWDAAIDQPPMTPPPTPDSSDGSPSLLPWTLPDSSSSPRVAGPPAYPPHPLIPLSVVDGSQIVPSDEPEPSLPLLPPVPSMNASAPDNLPARSAADMSDLSVPPPVDAASLFSDVAAAAAGSETEIEDDSPPSPSDLTPFAVMPEDPNLSRAVTSEIKTALTDIADSAKDADNPFTASFTQSADGDDESVSPDMELPSPPAKPSPPAPPSRPAPDNAPTLNMEETVTVPLSQVDTSDLKRR